MCGIFGIIAPEKTQLNHSQIRRTVNALFKLSESRGKEAAGMAIRYGAKLQIIKAPVAASTMLKTKKYQNIWDALSLSDGNNTVDRTLAIIGHSRLVTNGTEDSHENNQPVYRDKTVCIHNGIIVNDTEIWEGLEDVERHFEVDTEVLPALLQYYVKKGKSLVGATQETLKRIKGTASFVTLFTDLKGAVLASNNGSLYFAHSPESNVLFFASEIYILHQLMDKSFLKKLEEEFEITHVLPNSIFLIHFDETLTISKFNLKENLEKIPQKDLLQLRQPLEVNQSAVQPSSKLVFSNFNFNSVKSSDEVKLVGFDQQSIQNLRRCTKCILPETFPFISFDSNGVCNYCHHYKKIEWHGEKALMTLANKYRRSDNVPDCLIPFSGGRDSSYSLHYAKKILGLNPVAYTYDWGMITDIARRNISRLCGDMGVEHILISADIRKKRKNIRKNVLAWLAKPSLGTIPLFMAGDKQFFFFANRLKEQMQLDFLLFGMNPLERTDFKVAFTGINELKNKNTDKHYNLSIGKKLQMITYYGTEYLKNPRYLNNSIWDTIFGFFSYYMIPQNYYTFYEYIKWNENTINKTLIEEYDWETDPSTKTTWRIGDGTASFYNYIYYKVAGFSENDTFRSNQIREGMISRSDALALTQIENQPRFEAIKWYCDTIHIDFAPALKKINNIPTLY